MGYTSRLLVGNVEDIIHSRGALIGSSNNNNALIIPDRVFV